MLSKSLFGRLFQLVPGHFKRKNNLYYSEEFRLGNKVMGEFCYSYVPTGRVSCSESSTIILRPSHGKFRFEENLRVVWGVGGMYIDHKLLNIGHDHICSVNFDDLGSELISLIDKKKDSDIIVCSCCNNK
jgi:hypothetical protein